MILAGWGFRASLIIVDWFDLHFSLPPAEKSLWQYLVEEPFALLSAVALAAFAIGLAIWVNDARFCDDTVLRNDQSSPHQKLLLIGHSPTNIETALVEAIVPKCTLDAIAYKAPPTDGSKVPEYVPSSLDELREVRSPHGEVLRGSATPHGSKHGQVVSGGQAEGASHFWRAGLNTPQLRQFQASGDSVGQEGASEDNLGDFTRRVHLQWLEEEERGVSTHKAVVTEALHPSNLPSSLLSLPGVFSVQHHPGGSRSLTSTLWRTVRRAASFSLAKKQTEASGKAAAEGDAAAADGPPPFAKRSSFGRFTRRVSSFPRRPPVPSAALPRPLAPPPLPKHSASYRTAGAPPPLPKRAASFSRASVRELQLRPSTLPMPNVLPLTRRVSSFSHLRRMALPTHNPPDAPAEAAGACTAPGCKPGAGEAWGSIPSMGHLRSAVHSAPKVNSKTGEALQGWVAMVLLTLTRTTTRTTTPTSTFNPIPRPYPRTLPLIFTLHSQPSPSPDPPPSTLHSLPSPSPHDDRWSAGASSHPRGSAGPHAGQQHTDHTYMLAMV
uniref:Uncharacterized protein n=1 Tax=Haptolina brevifila TaxID=156173 RepID=A0A7S2G4L1_9EUKA|mmetsp:Transcript_26715/g.53672  ORF Transcript_26715/g.53672 Transcript_26715/m.53672 type:complete len:552 (+) Transcript_26715:86-1741(+)